MHTHWVHVGRGAAGLGAAMGLGRFAYTPILPLMTAQTALTPQAAGDAENADAHFTSLDLKFETSHDRYLPA